MRSVHALFALAFVGGASAHANEQAITLALSPQVINCTVGDRVTLVVTLTNSSKTPRYLHSDLALTLDYAVKHSSGAVMRRFNDPPLFGRVPQHTSQRIWVDAGRSLRFAQRLPLTELGILEPGEFNLVGFWSGSKKTESQLESEDHDISFSHSEPVKLVVSGRQDK